MLTKNLHRQGVEISENSVAIEEELWHFSVYH
jgi:hypothetical protein